jgi:hypothetical protein
LELFVTKDVLELAELPQRTLAEWIEKEIVTPAVKGHGGRGGAEQFTRMQVVGVLVGVEQRRSERGCALSYVGEIYAAFAAMDEGKLLEKFKEGRTHLVMIHVGGPMLRAKEFDWPDVWSAYSRVTKYAKSMKLVGSK